VFSALYTNGHLVTSAFSVAMALAFAISAARVPNQRQDLWFSGTFLLTASAGLVEMGLATHPSLGLARADLALIAGLLGVVCIGFHAQYAGDALTPARRRQHRRWVIVYAAASAGVAGALVGGLLDLGAVHPVTVWGARSAMIASPWWAFGVLLAFVLGNTALLAPVLLGEGERRGERRLVAVPMMLVPFVTVYELTITVGVNPGVPMAGYFAAMAGLTGAFVLAERFRALAHGGSVVGSYTIDRRLGGGGMADVYLARCAGSGALSSVVRRVALKRLRPEFVADPAFVQMFLDEARIVARLAHPHIVALHDVGQDRGELYLAMELVEGPSLSRMAKVMRQTGQGFDPDVVIEIGVQLADALQYAHALAGDDGRPLELIHRDVSPQNILITKEGHLKLADFGIARSADRMAQTATGMIKGKISYMAPEQIRGDAYDQRVDLYATGVVLFELLSGCKPYEGNSEATVLHQVLQGHRRQVTWSPAVPHALIALIEQALDPDPGRRPADASRLRGALLPLRSESMARQKLARLVSVVLEADELARLGDSDTKVAKKAI
jgi:hypothetical protein